MKGILTPVQENAQQAPGGDKGGDESGQWPLTLRSLSPKEIRGGGSSARQGSPENEDGLHWSYRQQKSGIPQTFDTKDTCPFSREDADPRARPIQPPTPHRRSGMSPPPSLHGATTPRTPNLQAAKPPYIPDVLQVAEKVLESRRDWRYRQENPELDDLCPLTPQSTFMSQSMSAKSFNG